MVLSLIFGKKYAASEINNNDTGINIITFDTMLTEEHRYTSRVTNYPVERGTLITDHILNLPDSIILTGFVTDTPLNIFATFNRSADVFNKLINIHQNRQIVSVVTGLRIYDNMALVTLDVPRTAKSGQALTFNIEFQRVLFSDVVNVPLNVGNVFSGVQIARSAEIIAQNTNIPFLKNDPNNSLKDQGATTVNMGVQSPVPIPTAVLPNVSQLTPLIAGILG